MLNLNSLVNYILGIQNNFEIILQKVNIRCQYFTYYLVSVCQWKNVVDYYRQHFHWKISTLFIAFALLFLGGLCYWNVLFDTTKQIFKLFIFLGICCYIFVICLRVGIYWYSTNKCLLNVLHVFLCGRMVLWKKYPREALQGNGKFEFLLVIWGNFFNLIIYNMLQVIL